MSSGSGRIHVQGGRFSIIQSNSFSAVALSMTQYPSPYFDFDALAHKVLLTEIVCSRTSCELPARDGGRVVRRNELNAPADSPAAIHSYRVNGLWLLGSWLSEYQEVVSGRSTK